MAKAKALRRRDLFGMFGMKRLAQHFAAQVSVRRAARDTDSIIELRRLAVLIALDKYGRDIDLAVAWLVEAGFGDDVLNGVRTYYRSKLDAAITGRL